MKIILNIDSVNPIGEMEKYIETLKRAQLDHKKSSKCVYEPLEHCGEIYHIQRLIYYFSNAREKYLNVEVEVKA